MTPEERERKREERVAEREQKQREREKAKADREAARAARQEEMEAKKAEKEAAKEARQQESDEKRAQRDAEKAQIEREQKYRQLSSGLSEGIGAGINSLGTLASTRSGPAAAKAGADALTGLATGGVDIAVALSAMTGPVGIAAGAAAKLGGALLKVGIDVTQWGEQLHETNMQFAQFSGAMAGVQARQMVRDINLSRIRGERRAEGAEALAEQRHSVNVGLANLIDKSIDPAKNQVVRGLYDISEGALNPKEKRHRELRDAIGARQDALKTMPSGTAVEAGTVYSNDPLLEALMPGLREVAMLRTAFSKKKKTTKEEME